MRYRALVTLAVVLACVLALELACALGWVARTVIIPPSEMVGSLRDILWSGEFNRAIALTLTNVMISVVISISAGFVLGVAIHASDFLRRAVEPYLASYYAVPTFIFYPVFIVLFGVNSAAIIAIAVLLSIVAMITATMNGLDRIPTVLLRTARIMRLSPVKTALLIQLPAAAPYFFTGARLSVAYSFIGVIASEFILSGDGLGYAIAYAYNNFENRQMYGLMLLIVIAVTLVNMTLDRLDRRLQSRLRR
ncbi:NitT/TauT family transport system permease protein [Bosea sp. OK403]|jgi:NitT/TauT family transport system permease protein|uniref:ABC transporter permease n=1 Tax=Bosea sp. OK403 TaxID=1855286 RepID=UPI0008F1459B|nr:ABC transporter permease subunit [Bosea sp. OK403]SFJ60056.1 NitT/TauT family transport system permease protein [Bosea sp. OK403]